MSKVTKTQSQRIQNGSMNDLLMQQIQGQSAKPKNNWKKHQGNTVAKARHQEEEEKKLIMAQNMLYLKTQEKESQTSTKKMAKLVKGKEPASPQAVVPPPGQRKLGPGYLERYGLQQTQNPPKANRKHKKGLKRK